MPNARVVAIQGKGKTSGMLFMANRIIGLCPELFCWDDVYANYKIKFDGAHYLPNEEMRQFLKKVYAPPSRGGELGEWRYKIILIDEIDGLYPQWTHNDKAMREELSGVYQDEKLHNWLMGTTHKPNNFNKILRDACEIIIRPSIDKSTDTLTLRIIDGRYQRKSDIIFPHFSLCYDRYERGGTVV